MGELQSIRVFLAVVDPQGFAGAARQLGLTPASATRAIAALEDRPGVQRLVRATRQGSPTSAGAVHAARVAEGLAEAARDARGAGHRLGAGPGPRAGADPGRPAYAMGCSNGANILAAVLFQTPGLFDPVVPIPWTPAPQPGPAGREVLWPQAAATRSAPCRRPGRWPTG